MDQKNTEQQKKLRVNRESVFTLVIIAAILLLFVFFLRGIMIPYIRMELHNDIEGAEELLRSKGIFGFIAVILVEALQMVVVFIPAEFIQISAGLSYPFWLALLLCDAGVCLGATIIFVLQNTFHYQSTAYERRRQKIDRISLSTHQRNSVIFMFLLFIMPILPFGVICFYGSSTKLSYRKYIGTVAAGALPSIIASNLMARAGKAFIVNDLPFWLLILIIILVALLLFVIIYFLMDRFFLKDGESTPDSPVYTTLFCITRLWQGISPRLTIHDERLKEAELPYVMLVNHASFFDFNYIHHLAHHRNPAYLVNEFYCSRPILKKLRKMAGILPKKLFYPDMAAPIGIFRTLRSGYPGVIFPEGRVSPDSRSNPIVEEGAAFYKQLKADLVLVRIRGAYFAGPKWRRRHYHRRAQVVVQVERVLKQKELNAMSDAELNQLISDTLYQDDTQDLLCTYPQRNKARGLEKLLYRCPDCGALYTTESHGNTLRCIACGSEYTLNEQYRFNSVGDTPDSIPGWYDRIREMELAELAEVHLETPVHTVIYGANGGKKRREKGVCTLTPKAFSYHSDKTDFTIPAETLPALEYTCGKEFELYYNNELHRFYPDEQGVQAARWALIVDLLSAQRRTAAGRDSDIKH